MKNADGVVSRNYNVDGVVSFQKNYTVNGVVLSKTTTKVVFEKTADKTKTLV